MGFLKRKPKSEHVTSQELRWREEFEAIRKANDKQQDLAKGNNASHHLAMEVMALKKKAPNVTFDEYKDQLKPLFRRAYPTKSDRVFETVFKKIKKELTYLGHKDDFVDQKDAAMIKTAALAVYRSRLHSVYTKNGKKYVKYQGAFVPI